MSDRRGEVGWLRKALKSLGIAVAPAALDAVPRLLDLLEKWNTAVRLVGHRDRAEWPELHVLDSLTPLLLVEAPARLRPRRVVDIGAGAGFPSLPLALACPAWHFTLVEANQKKARFLRTAIAELGLANAKVEPRRAEDAPSPTGDWVLSRAVAAPDLWLALARPWTAPNGSVIAMLGRDQPPDATLRAMGEPLGLRLERVVRCVLPRSGAQRALAQWVLAEGVLADGVLADGALSP